MVPKKKNHVDKLKRVQKTATQLIPELSTKSYSDRLKALKLPTLKYGRYRGDVIELFKVIEGMYDPACVPHLDFMELTGALIRTKGNKFKLAQHHCHYDFRKYNFTNRVIPTFNKKLSYRRGTARCVVSVKILPIATQQCTDLSNSLARNYLYDKS